MSTHEITTANVYRANGVWSYAAWAGDEYDHSDTLDATSLDEAMAEVAGLFPGTAIKRVDDVTV